MRWLLLVLLAAAAPLSAQQTACSFTLAQTTFLLAGTGTGTQLTATVSVTANYTSCSWSLTPVSSWITTQGGNVSGTGTLQFSVSANPATTMRQGTVTFSGDGGVTGTITVMQLAGTCVYTVSPTSVQAPVGGSTGTAQITTGCSWTSSSGATWLTSKLDKNNLISSDGVTNFGNGNVNYTVAANTCVAPRSTTLNIGTSLSSSPYVTVNQDGSTANLTLSQTTLAAGPGATTGRITVTTGDGCGWSVYSDSGWLQVTSTTATTGLGSFAYSVLANTGSSARTGTIHVGTATFTVTQQAPAAPAIQLNAVLNGGSYASGGVSPGEIVALFGTNMGPTNGVSFTLSGDGKSIPTTLAGVTVTFGSAPAVLLYASATQINAIVPFGVSGGSSTTAQVSYGGQTSNTLTLPVVTAIPAIYSQDYTGAGPGAILNQDSQLNASLTPAGANTVIQIFATGCGPISPAVADGYLSPTVEPLARLTTTPITVTIGGVVSPQVAFAGNAPGEVAGFIQINAIVPAAAIPAGATSSTQVPVVVQVGTAKSQSGLTVFVK